ncbi:MAG: hypothetical protein J6I72_09840 [Muribaculaceae bacterium]|nr:hypothetical protein [Muribaculaceae bacterium]
MGLLESIIRSAQQGGGGLGDILGQLGQDGRSTTGSTMEEIQRRMNPQGDNTSPSGDISIEDLERQMGIGTGRRTTTTGGYAQGGQPYQQQYPQQYPQQQYPQQQYPQETPTIPMPQQNQEVEQPSGGGGLFGGGLMSILKVIGMGALAAFVLKKFNK